ncbi:TetR/AcrR family transcriptional regulator [Nocardia sp. BMG51109]|uniref:TetR/AcrR family transcriptional regulator n=1 Tax=Nocardia sp. BMG51109 TaxID=1056816 RepID=UPI0004672ACE|nr:TetR/AcrR family transcriptional regulator [Nocardia sp. BMG51109]
MVKRAGSRDHVEAGIVAAAADVLAARGPAASMADIAEAAGVGRATLYRYFPNREALLEGLTVAALGDLLAKIADAELESAPVPTALARLTRGFLTAGSKYAALLQPGSVLPDKDEQLQRRLGEPIVALFARGVADGTLRADLSTGMLFELFTGLLEKALHTVVRGEAGVEQASAAVLTVFLDGARVSGSSGR